VTGRAGSGAFLPRTMLHCPVKTLMVTPIVPSPCTFVRDAVPSSVHKRTMRLARSRATRNIVPRVSTLASGGTLSLLTLNDAHRVSTSAAPFAPARFAPSTEICWNCSWASRKTRSQAHGNLRRPSPCSEVLTLSPLLTGCGLPGSTFAHSPPAEARRTSVASDSIVDPAGCPPQARTITASSAIAIQHNHLHITHPSLIPAPNCRRVTRHLKISGK
jgi:hypothetical protein